MSNDRIMVAMSGGVDSSVTAALLKEAGYDVIGVTMKLVDEQYACNSSDKSCCGYDSVLAAKMVADVIGIKHITVNSVEAFSRGVIENFISEYKIGRTPNPCINCNTVVKFDFLMNKMKELGCSFIATGHYATIKNGILFKGIDTKKDQSYFLYGIYNSDSSKIMFPLGDKIKPQIRVLARKFNLPVAEKRESQDICFIPDGNYHNFLSDFILDKPGNIISSDGTVVEKHNGLHKYTIGQRKGIGAYGDRKYVTKIDFDTNTLYIGEENELYRDTFTISKPIFRKEPDKNNIYDVKIRYATKPVSAKAYKREDGTFFVETETPVKSVTKGQSAVFYDGDEVLGGGIIELS